MKILKYIISSLSLSLLFSCYVSAKVINGVEIIAQTGDITAERADAIVNSGNPQLAFNGTSGVNKAIWEKVKLAGYKRRFIEKISSKKPAHGRYLKPSTVIVTKRVKLGRRGKRKHILTAIAPNFNKKHRAYGKNGSKQRYLFAFDSSGKGLYKDTYYKSLKAAESLHVKVVALPLFCASSFIPDVRHPREKLAKIAVRTAIKFCRKKRRGLRKIVFVLGSASITSILNRQIRQVSRGHESSSRVAKQRPSAVTKKRRNRNIEKRTSRVKKRRHSTGKKSRAATAKAKRRCTTKRRTGRRKKVSTTTAPKRRRTTRRRSTRIKTTSKKKTSTKTKKRHQR